MTTRMFGVVSTRMQRSPVASRNGTTTTMMMLVMTLLFLVSSSSSNAFQFHQQQQSPYQCRPKSPFITSVHRSRSPSTKTTLWMGKLRNKQAELQRKMAEAKQARIEQEQLTAATSSSAAAATTTENDITEQQQRRRKQQHQKQEHRLSDEEIKQMNDRKRFEQLLSSSVAMSSMRFADGEDDDFGYDGSGRGVGGGSADVDMSLTYLSLDQEEENIDAYARGVERFFEGDTAPEDAFEELVSIKSENAIGETGKKRLLPWLRGKDDDYVVVVCDPRQKSPEFHDTIKGLHRFLPKDMLRKTVFINVDTPAENRRFLKKNNLMTDDGGKIILYSDEKMEWMRSYTALGQERFSMTLFVLANGRIQKLVRDLSSVNAPQVVESVVNAAQKRRL